MLSIGRVKWFNTKKGYGFITREDNEEDIFVHYTSISGDGYRALEKGEDVQFELVEGPKGLQAQNVSKVQQEASSF
ncbi:MAG: cold shock domain-containing protein [candidate division Zixibacteria bacterium]